MPVSIRIAPAQQQTFELHCGRQSRGADAKEIESLTDDAGREYFGDGQPDDSN